MPAPTSGSSIIMSSEAIRMEPLGRTSSSRPSGQNGTANANLSRRTGDTNPGLHKRNLYEQNGVAVCSQKRALCITVVVFATLFAISLIIAYAGPQNGTLKSLALSLRQYLDTYLGTQDCPCAGEKPANYVIEEDDDSEPIATNGEIFPWDNVRLPDYVHPTRYNITIHPNLTTLEVKGMVTIEFYVDQETNNIVFHSKNLTVTERMVLDKKGHRLKISKMLEYPKHQQVYLELEESKFKKKGNYSVHLRFNSKLKHELEGFYLSSYISSDQERRYLATTHFEPTYARSAFPCFDEPRFKAKFKVSIFRDRFHIALCNMPIVNTEDAGFYMGTGLLRDDFQESVEMSTYLVAFVVCDFKRLSQMTQRNVSVSVYAAEAMLPQANYAVKTAAKTMDYFESFFGVQYPLPKLDLIAIPDFAAGAMENWGLITYRETSILYDPRESSAPAHEWVAVVIAHELAHQWFGNLVTMKWWNDLWLNEGAASFFEYKGVSHISPEWSMMDQFILDKIQPALDLDALASSHPISVPVKDPSEIESIFDPISYNKGASVLYMLEGFLSEHTLRIGLNDYLKTHAYGNADTNDLWSVFTKRVNKTFDVKAIMDTWTQQTGFPLITISREGNMITASQKRFLISPNRGNESELLQPKSPFKYKWYVPLSFYTSKEPKQIRNIWMNMTDVTFEVPADAEFIKCNVNQTGFYRVSYPASMWTSIIETLLKDHEKFSPADRANLIDDAFTLCKAGELNASIPLQLSLYLLNEREYVPWATALSYLHSWKEKLSESSAYKRYIIFFKKLLTPVTQYVGWNDDGSHLKKLLRIAVLQSAVELHLDTVVKPTKDLFDEWMKNQKTIAPNIREVVYAAGVKFGGQDEWKHCWETYRKTIYPSEKRIMLQALGATTDPWLLQRYLLLTLNRTLVRPQDVDTVISAVAKNPEGKLLAWRHLKAHWPEIQNLVGNGSLTMGGLIQVVTSDFFTEYDHREVKQFFKNLDVGSGERMLEQSLETIKFNIHWVKKNADTIDEWLINHLEKKAR
ncbi:hypothetical protein QAD02_019846 [Eretmocerus hayati]|uniref:Uncharacterized protein n=1 Tax=Eretmocerus hayati TaxID=131215 RepID=A0ACC2PKD2_9HYME|nr:hypothetical protein QAD02_019846 [Eretmocerus hayati]